MSAPNDEENPWLSLAELLKQEKTVAILATAIEKFGIQTYDRFGRRIPATDDGPEENIRKSHALNLLASYYAYCQDSYSNHHDDTDPGSWFEYDSPLEQFGWPSDEKPEFDKISSENVPESLKPKKHNLDAEVPTRNRRSHLIIIASLCKQCGINDQERGASQRIMKLTHTLGCSLDDETIRRILRNIPDALESRET